MAPEETGNHHSVFQRTAETLLVGEEENRQLSGPIDPHFPLSTGQAKQTEKLPSTTPDKVNSLWGHFQILGIHLNISCRKSRHHLQCLGEETKHEDTEWRSEPTVKLGCHKNYKATDLLPEGAVLGTAYGFLYHGPLDLWAGWANEKGRGSLAFFFIHACFANITCLADYMIIIFKGCQGSSGIIIIWFAGFRDRGNTLRLGGRLESFTAITFPEVHSHNLRLFLQPNEKPKMLNETCSKEVGRFRRREALHSGLDWRAGTKVLTASLLFIETLKCD